MSGFVRFSILENIDLYILLSPSILMALIWLEIKIIFILNLFNLLFPYQNLLFLFLNLKHLMIPLLNLLILNKLNHILFYPAIVVFVYK